MKRREFSVGDLLLRKAIGNARDASTRKLAPTWEGPYRITAIAGAGAYYLEDLDARPLPQPWNVYNLKIFTTNCWNVVTRVECNVICEQCI